MVAPNTNTSTFENISVRKGYSKGQNAMLMKWSKPNKLATVTFEPSQGPHGQRTVKFIANAGLDFRMESNTSCCWRDNTCVKGTRKEIQHKMAKMLGIKSKLNRIDLMNKFGDVVVSFSAPDEETYRRMSNVLTGIIGPSKCEVEDTKAERYRKQHLMSLRRGGKRRKIRRKTRKHKTRKTKRKRKTKRNKRKRKRKTKRRR